MKRRNLALIAIATLTTIAIMSFLSNRPARDASYSSAAMEMAEAEMAPAAARLQYAQVVDRGEATGLDSLGYIDSIDDEPAGLPDRYLIRNAHITIECEDANAVTDALAEIAANSGGYVSNMQFSENAYSRRSANITVRVPQTSLERTLDTMDELGNVISRSLDTQDVTEEYVDTESRIRNLKRAEERVLDHLNRTAKLEDILTAERELTRLRSEIERMEGRIRYLSDRVTFSTIACTLVEEAKGAPISPTKQFSSAKVFTDAARSLLGFAQVVWTLGVWAAVWSVIWVPAIFLAWIASRRFRNASTARPVS